MIKYATSYMVDDIDFKGVAEWKVVEVLGDLHEDLTLVIDRGLFNGKNLVIWSFHYLSDSPLAVGGGLSHRRLSQIIERTIDDLDMEEKLRRTEWERDNAKTNLESSIKLVRSIGKDRDDNEA